jgi:hypothetical protein
MGVCTVNNDLMGGKTGGLADAFAEEILGLLIDEAQIRTHQNQAILSCGQGQSVNF